MNIKLSCEFQFSNDVESFIENTIFPMLKINELNDDNIDDVAEYAFRIETSYVGLKGLSKEEKILFGIATKTGDELAKCINLLNKNS